jgi:hypothetical protein
MAVMASEVVMPATPVVTDQSMSAAPVPCTPVVTDGVMSAVATVSAAPVSATPVSATPVSAAPVPAAPVPAAAVSAPGEGLRRRIVRGESGQSEHQDRNRSNRQFAKHCRVLLF